MVIHEQLIMYIKIYRKRFNKEKSINLSSIIQQRKKMFIVFDDMIVDMEVNIKLSPIVSEFFLRGQKHDSSFVFISQSHFKVPKIIRLNAAHYFIKKIPKKENFNK